jgi:photosystem II stability/assembly factor-like uncharacterized protein
MQKAGQTTMRFLRAVGVLVICLSTVTVGQDGSSNGQQPFDLKLLGRLEWRSIGPANMGGRIADIEGVPGNPNIVYVASSSGGLWKTINGGTTWSPIFERQGTISMGDIALEPNNPDVIWAGTGESATRNSVSFGDGVYRSNDGGKSWQHLGLKETERISKILIHPRNPDTVYVGALGHAFAPNPERGVFMTTDGGKTWQKTLYIDDQHGVSDMDIDPSNPNILYAGMWRFERKPWTFTSGDEKGGLFRSIDGGRTWTKLTNGLPKLLGRIGVQVAPSNPNIVYAMVESKEGSLFRSEDRGETFKEVSKDRRIVGRGFYYTHVRVDPMNENRVYAVASPLMLSIDGGRTFKAISPRTHIDYHALWIDPKNPNRLWQGQDGGVAVSYDQGDKWEYVNNIPLGQFYQVHADNRLPYYWVMGGLQDNGSWSGPSRSREPAGIMNEDWRMVSFGDGFWMLNHADNPDLYLSESQGGGIVRTDMRTREQQSINPQAQDSGGGPAKDIKYRFNWNAPIVLSPHDKNTVYFAGNVVFKSSDFGKTWASISPDLTTNDPEKQKEAGGPVANENSTAEYHCTVISLAESPLRAGTIWAGSDDGNLQLTTDGGKTWSNLIRNVNGVAANSPVSHVEASRTGENIAYVSFDRHMFDDFKPYAFKTSDGGRSWINIAGDLPEKAYMHIVREDPKNPNLLYAGTELGLFASYTGGSHWISLGLKNLPNVAVHDIVIHPRENDLILATHGRSLWILDDATPIQRMSSQLAATDSLLFDLRPSYRAASRFTRYGIGDKVFTGPNPAAGALITYYLKDKPDDKASVKIQILDGAGKVVRELTNVPREQGVNRTNWDLTYESARRRRPPSDEETGFFGGPRGPQALPGAYTVRLVVGDKSQEKTVQVVMDPMVEVATSDLQAAFDLVVKLRDMQSASNDGLRALDSLKEQLSQIEKTMKERMPDAQADLAKSLDEWKKQLSSLELSLARPQDGQGGLSGGARLADRLSGLFGDLNDANAAPTQAQREYFNQLQADFEKRLPEINRFISESVPKMNETLRRLGAPVLVAGKPIEVK